MRLTGVQEASWAWHGIDLVVNQSTGQSAHILQVICLAFRCEGVKLLLLGRYMPYLVCTNVRQ